MIRQFTDNDYNEMVSWYADWKESAPPKELLPQNGFIAPGVCAGFLYLTDSKLALIDCYISNPNKSKEERDKNLNKMTEEIIKCAKSLGYRVLNITSNIPAIKKRAETHGFKYFGDTSVYMREI